MNKLFKLAALLIALFSSFARAENSCPLRQEIGQLIIAEYSGNLEGFKEYAARTNLGGVIFLSYHMGEIRSPNDMIRLTNSIQSAVSTGMFISVDQEGGLVQRLGKSAGFTWAPAAQYVGEAFEKNKNLPRELGEVIGEELAAVGVNLNFAPVADVATDKNSEIVAKLKRGYSSDPAKVGAMVGQMVEGMQKKGVMATAKHFPGHGDTQGDSHSGIVELKKSWQEVVASDLVPFIEAINKDVAFIMSGHIDIKECGDGPASLNKDLLTDLLRDSLGFRGLVITDDLSMSAITSRHSTLDASVKAVLAGNDQLIVRGGSDKEIIEHLCAISSGTTAEAEQLSSRIRESFERIMEMKRKYGVLAPAQMPLVDRVSTAEHRAVVADILKNSPSGVGVTSRYLPEEMSQGLKDLIGSKP